jgi:hypothetical protein
MNIPTQQPVPAQPTYSDRQFLHTQTAAVIVPLMQSAVTGAIVFIVTLVIAFKVDAMDLFSWPLILSVLAFGATWLWLQRRWLNLTNLEAVLGRDLNGDHIIGEKKQVTAPTVIRIENIEKGHYRSRDIRLSADDDQLHQLANGFSYGRPFTEREWTGAGKPFSSAGFRALRSEMLKYGLIEQASDADPRRGFKLTTDGEEWRKRYALPSPTLDDDGV